jgi:2-polyprenyl-6-hydroxyphenyl methylase/3-demethylubiquinone-9 3-methyltransferase
VESSADSSLRFEFGKNWGRFLKTTSDKNILEAETSLKKWLGVESLEGKRFLDIGSGSGLFSLAARRLGATVFSFDYDRYSVACTRKLQEMHYPGDVRWQVEQGDALDSAYLEKLGAFDIVYSWGVLHHTGQMWKAIGNASERVGPGGTLWIALYNDQGRASRTWWAVKHAYNRLPAGARFLVLGPAFVRTWGPTFVRDALRGKPWSTWKAYGVERGMSPWPDVVDWVGGYPFEVCKPEEVFEFLKARGFALQKLQTCAGGHGCNEFVFKLGHSS